MAKIKIHLNGTDYNIDQSALADVMNNLKTHFSTAMAGTGAALKFDGATYNIDATKLTAATNNFISHLNTIAGSGMKTVVGGVEYGIDSSKVAGAIAGLDTLFGNLSEPTPSEGLVYTLNNDGVSYSVTGIGTCTDTEIAIASEYKGLPVTSIGKEAFYCCSNLISVVIPASVTSVSFRVFFGCTGLTSITVASGNTKYHSAGNCVIETATGKLVFGCKNSVIPADGSVTSIGNHAFGGCDLVSITIPDSVKSIGFEAFNCCYELTTVELGANSQLTSIGGNAFNACDSLASITIPDSVTVIDGSAFSGCLRLTTIAIPAGVKSISANTFYSSGLTSITIPAGVKSIGLYAFSYCLKLTSIVFSGTMDQWNAITKGLEWNSKVPATYVQCSNGQVKL